MPIPLPFWSKLSVASLKTNLSAYWKFDEGANATALDATANGRNLTDLGGNTGSGTGKINTARGDFVSPILKSTDSAFHPGASTFSFTVWVNANSLSQNNFPKIAGIWSNSAGNREWMLNWDDTNKNFSFSVSTDGTATAATAAAGSSIATATWYFIACVWDGTNIKISVNGAAFVTAAYAGPVKSGTDFFAFAQNSGAIGWNGYVDESGYWLGRALTITEVGTIYNSGSGTPYASL